MTPGSKQYAPNCHYICSTKPASASVSAKRVYRNWYVSFVTQTAYKVSYKLTERWPIQGHEYFWFLSSWNEREGISIHLLLVVFCSSLFSMRSKNISNACVTGPLRREINRWPVDSLHKGPIIRKTFPCNDIIMKLSASRSSPFSSELR